MRTDDETGLSPAEGRDLRRAAGMMIPASEAFGVPGADDPVIFGDIVRSVGRDLADVREALSVLAAGSFADLDEDGGENALKIVLARGDRAAAALSRVILQCYYRDDRVLGALGVEARQPFPQGYVLEQGDWSLLDVVRDRAPLWRDDREA